MIVYSKASCGPCATVKYMLDKLGVDYEIRDVEQNKDFEAEWLQYAQTVPVVVANDRVVIGPNLSAIRSLVS